MTHENRTTRVVHSGYVQAGYGAVLGAFFGVMLSVAGLGPGGPIVVVALSGAVVGGLVLFGITRLMLGGGTHLAKSLVFPDAKGTYSPQYSHIQALEVQEKYAEALAEWLRVAESLPGNPSPLLRAADLQLRHLKNDAGALELYERVRRMPGIRDEHLRYASQKVIDIHLAPGGDEGRALVELRRFLTMFPTGREAKGARAALARLKAQRGHDVLLDNDLG